MRGKAFFTAALAAGLLWCATAQAATPELSTTNRLQDRRAVTAGPRSYVEDFENGRFSANGWHITGEMGGVWAPPLKLVDGVWFGVNGTWVRPATRFVSGWGYTRYDLPAQDGLTLRRTDFAPDHYRAALFGLTLTNPGAARTVTVNVDAHSELMGAYPWGTTTPISQSDNLPDHGSFDGRSLVFTDDGSLAAGAPTHHYAALVGSALTPSAGTAAATGGGFRGPQPGTTCAASDGASMPSACDDGPYGRGTGGELTYRVAVPAGGSTTVWIAVAGSDLGLAGARAQLTGALQAPGAELAAKVATRVALSRDTRVSLPGDRLLQNAIDWGKQNLADLTQTASDLRIRWTDQGTQYPAPLGTVAHARWFAAGYPDYPWIFATDVYYMRGLYDLADMARFVHDGATARWATGLANRLRSQFETTWWDPAAGQYAESLIDPGNQQSFQKHWIGVVPMEASLTRGTTVTPGVAGRGHALTALSARESACFSGSRPGSLGLFHTGCGGGADGKGDFEIFSLTTAIQAVGEGNYGRLGPGQQQRYTDANAETMFAEPATGGTPDEQPGVMPEIFPSAPGGAPAAGIPANIDRCWTCRSMVTQAWGNYGTVWPVVSQQLGVRPFLGRSALAVVPQVPQGQPSVAGSDIRLGGGAVDVFASHAGSRYTTTLALHDLRLRSVAIGATLPLGSSPSAVTIDGRRAHRVTAVTSNRGVEITVAIRGPGPHTLLVTAG